MVDREPGADYQFGLKDVMIACTAFAITFALFVTALSQQSAFLLFCAALMLGLSCGALLGFVVGGRIGIRFGMFLGVAAMFMLYVFSLPKFH